VSDPDGLAFDPARIVEALIRHGVEFVLVGGIAVGRVARGV
jgi:hypothetical protein